MNDKSNPNPSQPHGKRPPADTAIPQPSSQSGHRVMEPLFSAVNEGAQRAKAAAETAIPKVKAALSGATYWLGYGVSFASVFSYTIVKELAPEVMKAGWRDGGRSAKEAAENLASKLRAQPDASGATPSPGSGPSGPVTQPHAA